MERNRSEFGGAGEFGKSVALHAKPSAGRSIRSVLCVLVSLCMSILAGHPIRSLTTLTLEVVPSGKASIEASKICGKSGNDIES